MFDTKRAIFCLQRMGTRLVAYLGFLLCLSWPQDTADWFLRLRALVLANVCETQIIVTFLLGIRARESLSIWRGRHRYTLETQQRFGLVLPLIAFCTTLLGHMDFLDDLATLRNIRQAKKPTEKVCHSLIMKACLSRCAPRASSCNMRPLAGYVDWRYQTVRFQG
jgi:hypothetical protein